MGRNILCPSKLTLNKLKMFLLIKKKKKEGKAAWKSQIPAYTEDTVIGGYNDIKKTS